MSVRACIISLLFLLESPATAYFYHTIPTSCNERPLLSTLSCLKLTSGLTLAVDAGSGSSYSSGQSWLDSSGGGFNFYLGASNSAEGSDPTFTGTVGRLSSSEYWSFDGGDFFRFNTTNATWINNIHKDGVKFTYIAIIRLNAMPSPGVSVALAGTLGNDGSVIGHQFQITPEGAIKFQVYNSSTPCLVAATADSTLGAGAWHMVAVSIDENGGASGGIFHLDGTQIGAAFNPNYTSPAAGAATHTMELGSAGNGQRLLNNADRIALFAAWEGVALTQAQMNLVFQALRSRFGI